MAWVEPLGLAAGGAGLRAVLAELLGHRGQGRVGLVQLGQRDVDAASGPRAARAPSRDMSKPSRSAAAIASASCSAASSTAAWTSIRLGWLEEPPDGEVGAEQVAVAGHRGDVGQLGDQRPRGRAGRRRRRP